MPTSTEAEEHLRVIRSLMEKATIYRAVSAPTALAGGIAAMFVVAPPTRLVFDRLFQENSFHARWSLALFVTLLINTALILREARRRGDPLVSPGMRAAFRALLPPFLCGGIFFALFSAENIPAFLAIFYGLGLLATGHFAPSSICWLGWSFLTAGLALFCLHFTGFLVMTATPDLVMAATFGGFHLLYAVCTWPRKVPAVATGPS